MTSLETARLCAIAASNKHGEEIAVLDLRGISTFADFFIICSATSEPHLRALANGIEEELQGKARLSVRDGNPASQWLVMSYGDVVIHLFHHSKREFYRLEDLWSDAPRVEFPELIPVTQD